MTSSPREGRRASSTSAGGWWREPLAQPESSSTRRDRDRRELGALASDFGLSVEELTEIVRKGPKAADEIVAVLGELGLDSDGLKAKRPHQFSTLLEVCIKCDTKKACRRAIEGHTVDRDLSAICENYDTISELRLESQKAGEIGTNAK